LKNLQALGGPHHPRPPAAGVLLTIITFSPAIRTLWSCNSIVLTHLIIYWKLQK